MRFAGEDGRIVVMRVLQVTATATTRGTHGRLRKQVRTSSTLCGGSAGHRVGSTVAEAIVMVLGGGG